MKSILLPSLFVLGFSLLPGGLFAGEKVVTPASTPPAQESGDVLADYLTPAIKVNYDYDFPMSLEDDQGELSMHEIRLATPLFPVELSDQLIILTSFYYRFFEVDIDNPKFGGVFDLHTLRLPIEAIWLSSSTPWFVYGLVQPGISTDFDSVNSDSFDLTATVNLGYRFSKTFALAAGVYYTRDYGDESILPAIGLLWSPTTRCSLELSPDGLIGRYKCTDDWRLKLRASVWGGRWTVDDNGGQPRQLELFGYRAGGEIERRITDKCWISVGGGVNAFGNVHVEDRGGRGVLDSDLKEGAFIGAGLKWIFC